MYKRKVHETYLDLDIDSKYCSFKKKITKENYTCVYHDNDKQVCNIYSCSGVCKSNNNKSMSYLS